MTLAKVTNNLIFKINDLFQSSFLIFKVIPGDDKSFILKSFLPGLTFLPLFIHSLVIFIESYLLCAGELC